MKTQRLLVVFGFDIAFEVGVQSVLPREAIRILNWQTFWVDMQLNQTVQSMWNGYGPVRLAMAEATFLESGASASNTAGKETNARIL
jgi:hypothetical protein